MQANCLWAHATLHCPPSQAYLEAVSARMQAILPTFAAQHLVNAIWAMASCGYHDKVSGSSQAFTPGGKAQP